MFKDFESERDESTLGTERTGVFGTLWQGAGGRSEFMLEIKSDHETSLVAQR